MKITMMLSDIKENRMFAQDIKHFFFNVAKLEIIESYQKDNDFFLVFSDNPKDTLPDGARRVPLVFLVEARTDAELGKEKKELTQMLSEINLLVEEND